MCLFIPNQEESTIKDEVQLRMNRDKLHRNKRFLLMRQSHKSKGSSSMTDESSNSQEEGSYVSTEAIKVRQAVKHEWLVLLLCYIYTYIYILLYVSSNYTHMKYSTVSRK